MTASPPPMLFAVQVTFAVLARDAGVLRIAGLDKRANACIQSQEPQERDW